MFILLGTAAVLYIPDISVLVGNRPIMRNVHIVAGLLLPIPIILALASAAFRADSASLNRFTADDWRWLRSSQRRSGHIPVGKFNAGQKINAAFTLGAIVVMFVTGLIMWQNGPFSDDIRTGATFVHDWLTILIVIMVSGHVWMAMNDAEARRGMRTGEVDPAWAMLEHRSWYEAEKNSAVSKPEI
jgi:formate dehydrogenase subunit gamma